MNIKNNILFVAIFQLFLLCCSIDTFAADISNIAEDAEEGEMASVVSEQLIDPENLPDSIKNSLHSSLPYSPQSGDKFFFTSTSDGNYNLYKDDTKNNQSIKIGTFTKNRNSSPYYSQQLSNGYFVTTYNQLDLPSLNKYRKELPVVDHSKSSPNGNNRGTSQALAIIPGEDVRDHNVDEKNSLHRNPKERNREEAPYYMDLNMRTQTPDYPFKLDTEMKFKDLPERIQKYIKSKKPSFKDDNATYSVRSYQPGEIYLNYKSSQSNGIIKITELYYPRSDARAYPPKVNQNAKALAIIPGEGVKDVKESHNKPKSSDYLDLDEKAQQRSKFLKEVHDKTYPPNYSAGKELVTNSDAQKIRKADPRYGRGVALVSNKDNALVTGADAQKIREADPRYGRGVALVSNKDNALVTGADAQKIKNERSQMQREVDPAYGRSVQLWHPANQTPNYFYSSGKSDIKTKVITKPKKHDFKVITSAWVRKEIRQRTDSSSFRMSKQNVLNGLNNILSNEVY